MTTAARPTFEPARGGSSRGEKDLSAISKQYSSRDLPGHTRLKQRESGQATVDELQSRNFRRELEERERAATSSRSTDRRHASSSWRRESTSSSSSAAPPLPSTSTLDADDPADHSDSGGGESDDDDDDEAELMAELQRIKKERALEAVNRDVERRAEQERIRTENILGGNPLLSYTAAGGGSARDAAVKRRWDDDVVFKNCARVDPERKQPRFINDAIRNDFHRKFMDKYIK